VHSIALEKLGVPTAPVITDRFVGLVKYKAETTGMPLLRFTFVPHPISAQPHSLIRERVAGKDLTTGKPVMQEIIEALTKPPSADEKNPGYIQRRVPRLVGPDAPENLERLFLKNGWTDGLPIVLPTEERVAAMLKGTSHKPDEVVGKMAPSGAHEAWSYTVEKVAVNAVMAGCKPEYFPVVLAIASTGVISTWSSTSSQAGMVIVNGPMRKEIGMNWGIGAMGPHNHANATIGRAYQLLSRNLAGGLNPEVTYLGTFGNNLAYNNVTFAENEEDSPWEPFHVTKGFKPEESVVSICVGFGGALAIEWLDMELDWQTPLIKLIEGIGPSPNSQFLWVMDPLVAKSLSKVKGFETKKQVTQWLYDHTGLTAGEYWAAPTMRLFLKGPAEKGVEPFATWLKVSKDTRIPRVVSPDSIHIIVVGGLTNPFSTIWNDFVYKVSASVDKWR
jgi:hypothetical protein